MMAIALLAVVVLLSAGLPLLQVLANNPLLGSGLVLALFVIETVLVALPGLAIGVYIYPQDIAFFLLLLATVLRMLVRGGWTRVHWVWFAFASLAFLSFARGLGTFGPKSSGVEFRSFFYFIAGSSYFISFPFSHERQRQLLRQLQLTAFALVTIAICRWAIDLFGFPLSHSWLPPEETNHFRVVRAFQAFFLASVFVLSVDRQLRFHAASSWKWTAAVTLPTVLLLQHRSVWIATLVGLFGIYVFSRGSRGRLTVVLASAAFVGSLVALLVLGTALDQLSASLDRSAASAVSTNEGTFVWRIEGWQALLETRGNSSLDYVIGRPFGAGYLRYIRGSRVEVSPHNLYVQTLLRLGILGVLTLIVVYVILIKRALRRRGEASTDYASSGVLGTLLVMALTYYVAYGLTYEQSVLFALAATGLGRTDASLAAHRFRRVRSSMSHWVPLVPQDEVQKGF